MHSPPVSGSFPAMLKECRLLSALYPQARKRRGGGRQQERERERRGQATGEE